MALSLFLPFRSFYTAIWCRCSALVCFPCNYPRNQGYGLGVGLGVFQEGQLKFSQAPRKLAPCKLLPCGFLQKRVRLSSNSSAGSQKKAWSSFPCFFGSRCFLLFKEFPAFWGVLFPPSSKDFRGSEETENPCFFGGFPCLFPKKQGEEDQGGSLLLEKSCGPPQNPAAPSKRPLQRALRTALKRCVPVYFFDFCFWVRFWQNGFFAEFYFRAARFFSRILSPDFFSSSLWGKCAQKNPPGKFPTKSSRFNTTKIPDNFLQRLQADILRNIKKTGGYSISPALTALLVVPCNYWKTDQARSFSGSFNRLNAILYNHTLFSAAGKWGQPRRVSSRPLS